VTRGSLFPWRSARVTLRKWNSLRTVAGSF